MVDFEGLEEEEEGFGELGLQAFGLLGVGL